jgi:hypothetical protein
MKIELTTHFEQKFTMGSYIVGICRVWHCQKSCEIYTSLVQKKKLKKECFSSHKLLKHQLINFWSQGILGVKLIPNLRGG